VDDQPKAVLFAKEGTIRDNLARKLDVLEPGLQLIATEYPLSNARGSKGFIDILAKDACGNRVIVELKRSNQAARQALHEIFKYLALFHNKERLSYGRIRCFIVSTEWDELRVPFAEFARIAQCQCDGFELRVDDDGNVLDARRHEPVMLAEPMKLFRCHSIFLFSEPSGRDNAVEDVLRAFENIGGVGCLAVAMDYHGPDAAVIYPHAVYVVIAAVGGDVLTEVTSNVIREYDYSDADGEDVRHSVEDEIGGRHVEAIQSTWDDFEVGYPEKFSTLLRSGWKIDHIVRWGTVPTEAAADDNELARMIAGVEGENTISFHHFTTPSLGIQWNEVREKGRLCLRENDQWLRGFDYFCNWVESEHRETKVGFGIYNPLNLPITLFEFFGRSDARYLPSFEIVAVNPLERCLCSLLGRIEWDGITKPTSAEDVFTRVYGGIQEFFLAQTLHDGWVHDRACMAEHGFYYALERAEEDPEGFRSSPVEVVDHSGELKLASKAGRGRTIEEFVAANGEYLRDLVRLIEQNSWGL
jgi:hypothetical protein